MGGKNFFCDYCRCYMKNDIKVRKTHNEGLSHTIMKANFMRKYEDPRKVYEEEIKKQPCTRYFKGSCIYDLFCRNTHFNEKQLKQLKKLVDEMHRKSEKFRNKRKAEKTFKQSLKLPWKTTVSKRRLKQLPMVLPPSLKPLRLSKLSDIDVNENKWG